MGIIRWLLRLTVRVWAVLALVVSGVIVWRAGIATDEFGCIQFATADRNYQQAYPTVVDLHRNFAVNLPQASVPDAVITVSENAAYRIHQSYQMKRVFSIPAVASVETITTGDSINLPASVSNQSVTWSPDNSQFAYYSLDRSSGKDIYTLVMANADGSNSSTFPLTDFNQIHYLNWSPDGQYLLVADYFYAWAIRATDRQVQVIASHQNYETVDAFEWSPRGHLLAYLWGAASIIPNQIVILDLESGKRSLYARSDKHYWWNGRLLWADNLRYVAAVGWVDEHMDVANLDGVGTSLINVGSDNRSIGATWLPESDQFLYMTEKNELVAYDAAEGRYQTIARDVFDSHVERGDDNHSLIFMQRLANGKPALVKWDTRDDHFDTLITAESKWGVSRFYSLPDRTKWVVVSWENDALNIDLYDLRSGEKQRLASGLKDFTLQPVESDDDTFMFYWAIADPNSRIYTQIGWDVYDLSGKRQYQFQGDATVLKGAYDARYFVPLWSPDRRYAVFAGTDPDVFKGLIVVSSDGQRAWQITEPVWKVDAAHIRWSPDSSKVAIPATIQGASHVLVYTADGKLLAKPKITLSTDYLQWTTCDM